MFAFLHGVGKEVDQQNLCREKSSVVCEDPVLHSKAKHVCFPSCKVSPISLIDLEDSRCMALFAIMRHPPSFAVKVILFGFPLRFSVYHSVCIMLRIA